MKFPYISSLQEKHITLIFFLTLMVYFIPLMTGKYFLTGDGPTHVYNSRVLSDWMQGKHLAFYEPFYDLNLNPDPNWTGHAILSILMFVTPAFVAEKILLSLYIFLFGVGCWVLVKKINRENTFMALLGLPFIYHFTFFNGFWNCALSLALALWVIIWWMNYRERFSVGSLLIGGILFTILYFTHLLGSVMALIVIASMILMELAERNQQGELKSGKHFLIQSLTLLLVSLPLLLLTLQYLSRKGVNPQAGNLDAGQLLDQYLVLTGLNSIGMDPWESIGVKITAFSIHIFLFWGLVSKIRHRRWNVQDGFFLTFLLFMIFYLNIPSSLAGGSVLVKRVQIIPYILLLGWVSQFSYPNLLRRACTFIFALSAIMIVISRLPAQFQSHQGIDEYVSVLPYIEEKSTVLPLSFNHHGLDEEKKHLSDMWLFMHAGDYLGAEKPLVMLSNYEASSGAFPLIYPYHLNPFALIGTNEGIEYQPPSVDIMNYHRETGIHIDYIVTWCMELVDQEHPYLIDTRKQLNSYYDNIYTTEKGRVSLFRLKHSLLKDSLKPGINKIP